MELRPIQPLNYNQETPITQENMQIDYMETYQSQPVNQAMYTLCQTPIYFNTLEIHLKK